MIDLELDCKGMNCPMPIVELTKAARSIGPGKRIEVTATDLAFKPDVEAWARRMGHSIEDFQEEDTVQRAIILLAN
ncbi:MAG: sulfurtransferase TusA family protein [Planctomycetaceae bacterium]|nr:sulfurtransferase TusA family protein [Planctomycetaceae bacterium]